MAGTAQTPSSPLLPVETAAQSKVEAITTPNLNGQQAPQGSAPSSEPRQPRIARANRSLSTRHSANIRFVVAALCVLASIAAASVALANPGEQPLKLVTFLSASLAALILIAESCTSWFIRPRHHSIFDIVSLLGATLVVAAGVIACTTSGSSLSASHSVLLITAPLLAVAALCVGNGFCILGINASRNDSDYLFPNSAWRGHQVALGDSITLQPGDVVPVDGRVTSGSIGLDERVLSPISHFRIREEQELLHAGSTVVAGSANISALSTIDNSCLAQLQSVIAPIVDESSESLRREDAKASRWSALAIAFFAATVAISWNERTHDYVHSLLGAGAVLLIGSICQVGEYLYGQRRALVREWLERGYLLGFASSARELASVTRVESDPSRSGTGSLVRATFIEVLDDRLDRSALCGFLVSLLGRAEDRTFLAAAEYCRRHASSISVDRALELREYPHRGMSGVVHGIELSVGSEDFLLERGIMMQPSESTSDEEQGSCSLLVAIDDDVVARLWLTNSQEDLFMEEGGHDFPNGVEVTQSSGVARELGADTLLIRGNESDLIGQTALREVSLFSPHEETLRRSTVIAFTPEIKPLGSLIKACRLHVRAVDRLRLFAGFGGLVTLATAFAGAFTPLIPLAWLVLTGVVVVRSGVLPNRGS